MNISLCNIPIQLKTQISAVEQEWADIFACHQTEATNPTITIEAHPLDQAPSHDPSLSIRMFNSESGSYSLATSADGTSTLSLASGAVLVFSNLGDSKLTDTTTTAQLYISDRHIKAGQTEDITLTILAPLLRRLSIYIVHAFGVAHPTKDCVSLIIGPSGSGKTTSGLFLLKNGWRYLGNDAIFLSENLDNQIVAWPSPGKINVHPKTVELLAPLSLIDKASSSVGVDGKYHFSAENIENKIKKTAQVGVQVFPEVAPNQDDSRLTQIPAGIALSQTMSQSVDNWDTITFEPHFAFLERLTSQTNSFKAINSPNLNSFAQAMLTL